MISPTGTFTNTCDYSCRKVSTTAAIALAVSLIAIGILLNPHVLSLGIGWAPSFSTLASGAVLGILSIALHCFNKKEPLTPIHVTNQDNCGGTVDIEAAKTILLKKGKFEKVTFDPDVLPHELTEGTCTALTLKFLEDFLRQGVSRGTIKSRVATCAAGVRESNPTMRTIQAAMNTIKIRPEFREIPCHQEKAEALLSLQHLRLMKAYKGIDWSTEDREVLEKRIKKLPKGVFFIRAICPSSNEKGEKHGHSLALITLDSETFYFYEPNDGIYEIKGATAQKSEQMASILKKAHEVWILPHMTFYQVTLDENPIRENS